MYKHILVPLDNTVADKVILDHLRLLARFTGSRLTLIHVADGFVARNQERLAESPEMTEDRDYLHRLRDEWRADGFTVEAVLATGEPTREILAFAAANQCDLIAMSTHGHGLLGDLVLGSVASEVRHRTEIPILMIRAPKKA